MILMILKIEAQKNDELPIRAENWWYELNDQEKWELFRKHFNNELILLESLKNSTIELKNVEKIIENNNNFLKKYKPFYPKFGFNLNFLAGLNYNNNINKIFVDVYGNINFMIFFLKGRFFLMPGIDVKIYDGFGGGINFGIGVLF